ncbi:imelysin family protein [Shimia sp. NS0008-38b]|uniref:imelysin family protein n=1 Tax=Shimia sp. NS0008-38b TaxID=3127653 RepID=UPI00310A8DA5
MFKRFAVMCAALCAPPLMAQEAQPVDQHALVQAAVKEHIVPGFERLATATETLHMAAQADCLSTSVTLRAAYHDAFDAWMGVSHLRFGPSEVDDRGFALAFWPDTKGFTPKALSRLIAAEDPVINTAEDFAHVSVAGRGFFGLEYLLFDDRIRQMGTPVYQCALVQRVAADIALQANAILIDWQSGYGDTMSFPSEDGPFQTSKEALQTIFKTLDAGLQFDVDVRLGRPLGTFDKPRPTRAEARRSERSLRNVAASSIALEELASILATQTPALDEAYGAAFGLVHGQVADLEDDPVFAGVRDIQGRLRVEILQQYLNRVREITTLELGPALGVTGGFNALDGD